jgi:hypothetical protein
MILSKKNRVFVFSLVVVGLLVIGISVLLPPVQGYMTFGTTTNGDHVASVENYQVANNYTASATGYLKSIKFSTYADSTAKTFKMAIYNFVDDTGTYTGTNLGQTEAKTIFQDAYNVWYEYNFSWPYPSVVSGTKYYLMCWGSSAAGSGYCQYKDDAGTTFRIYRAATYNGSYPNTLTGWTKTANRQISIYGVISQSSTISGIAPANGSSGIHCTPRCNVTLTDIDGNAMKLDWFENSTGSWVHRQSNSSCANGTYRMAFSQASSYSTKYWWKVTVNDTFSNVSAWYSFTTEVNPWSNRAPTFGSESPSNNSDDVRRYHATNVTVSDLDGNATTVCFYSSTSDSPYSWTKQQQNNSVAANTTVRDMNSTYSSGWSTPYWWKVTANDDHVNSTVIYKFTTDHVVWVNRAPTIAIGPPGNNSMNSHLYRATNVSVADLDGNTTTVTFWNNKTGSWVKDGQNDTVPANSTVKDTNASYANSYSTKYWWRVCAFDGYVNTSKVYVFTTEAAPPVIWSNRAPTFGGISPLNNSIDAERFVTTTITVYDLDGNATTVCFWNNVSGSWLKIQQNNSVSANTTVRDMISGYSYNFTTRYWWKVTAEDETVNSSVVNDFMTRNESSCEFPFMPILIGATLVGFVFVPMFCKQEEEGK